MQARNIYLANRLREVLLDGKWIANTNCKEQILSVTWEQAIRKVNDLNSIAALTYHLNYYLMGINNVFQGGDLEIKDKYSFDLPEIIKEWEWQVLVSEFIKNAQIFVEKVEAMEDEVFDQPFVDEKYGSYMRNIEGVIEHCYYHLGQLSLIRKMVSASSNA